MRVCVYGLSSEGYLLGCKMAKAGVQVSLVDETIQSAIALTSEIARTYPNVTSFREDEPLLGMMPPDSAISESDYVFFAPRVRTGQENTGVGTYAMFKDVVKPVRQDSNIVYCVPTGFGGNADNMAHLERISGLQAGKEVGYFYYPLFEPKSNVIGTAGQADNTLAKLVSGKFVDIATSEYVHATDVLGVFLKRSSILEVAKLARDSNHQIEEPAVSELFLDEMVYGLHDLKMIESTIEGAGNMTHLVNGITKIIDAYMKRLNFQVKQSLKRRNLKATRSKVGIAWNIDPYEMRDDRQSTMDLLKRRLLDYIGEVESYEGSGPDIFLHEHTSVILACTKKDHQKLASDADIVVICANPAIQIKE